MFVNLFKRMPDPIEGYKIAASLLGGGAFGALITTIVTSYRNRIQPVGKRLDVSPLFTPSFVGSDFKPIITVSDGTTDYRFANLYVADLQIVNRGNRDLTSFGFGLTLSTGDTVVHAEPCDLDRHHISTQTQRVTPACPSRVLDFVLKPFNRGDSYTFKIFIVAADTKPGPITLGSSEAITFIEMPSIAETIAEVAIVALKLGPFRILVK